MASQDDWDQRDYNSHNNHDDNYGRGGYDQDNKRYDRGPDRSPDRGNKPPAFQVIGDTNTIPVMMDIGLAAELSRHLHEHQPENRALVALGIALHKVVRDAN